MFTSAERDTVWARLLALAVACLAGEIERTDRELAIRLNPMLTELMAAEPG